MKFWEIEMITNAFGYYEVVYMSDETWDLFGKYFKEIEDKINELKLLPENKNCFSEDGWWQMEFRTLNEEEQLNYNFDKPIRNANIVYDAIYEVLKKYDYDYNKEAMEIDKYIESLDCITTVKYQVKKSQVEKLNKFIEDMKEEI